MMKPTKPTIITKIKKMNPNRQKRLFVVFSVVLLLLLAILIRVGFILQRDDYRKKALRQQIYTSQTIPYKRGEIVDRNRIVLATNKMQYNLILDPNVILYYRDIYKVNVTSAICTALWYCFGITPEQVGEILEKSPDSTYIRLKREITYEERENFLNFVKNLTDPVTGESLTKKIVGVWFEEEYLRYYPNDTLASHVIGFSGAMDTGSYGVEEYYNEQLIGTNGKKYGYYDALLNLTEAVNEKKDGNSLVLTIDANVQRVVERSVEKFLKEDGADNVGVIIMNPNNGEIYAMQSNYSYHLNEPRNLSDFYSSEDLAKIAMDVEAQKTALYKLWRNFCVSDAYEPGSTFKPITVATALEEDIVQKDSEFVCDGVEHFKEFDIHCYSTYGHGNLCLAETLSKSCNDALMQIGKLIGNKLFYLYQEHFQFGQKTGIDLPGESKGILIQETKLNETELATSTFGQSFTTTMVQMVSAYSALVNGGNYYQPHLVKRIVSAEGSVVREVEPVIINEAISKETSDYIREVMYLTVESGTAAKAKVNGYLIGGKTGTAQKYPRSDGKYLLSFLGNVPAENPEVVIYVVLDNVWNEKKTSVAGTASLLAAEILEQALPMLSLYPEGEIDYHLEDITEELLSHTTDGEPSEDNPYDENGNLQYNTQVLPNETNNAE